MQSELLAEYNELTITINALREQAKEKAKTILKQGMDSYFAKHGELVRCIAWHQYTPYHNDGEACEFSVHEPIAILWPVMQAEDDESEDYSEDSKYAYYAPDFDVEALRNRIHIMSEYEADPITWSKIKVNERNKLSRYAMPDNYYVSYPPDMYNTEELELMVIRAEQITEEFKHDTNTMLAFISSIDEDVMEQLFGNHVQIVVTAQGITIEDYNHRRL